MYSVKTTTCSGLSLDDPDPSEQRHFFRFTFRGGNDAQNDTHENKHRSDPADDRDDPADNVGDQYDQILIRMKCREIRALFIQQRNKKQYGKYIAEYCKKLLVVLESTVSSLHASCRSAAAGTKFRTVIDLLAAFRTKCHVKIPLSKPQK